MEPSTRRPTARAAGAARSPRLDRRLDPRLLGAVFAGGGIGTVARAVLGRLLPHATGAWPWSTFVVNVVGAFLLGCFARLLRRRPETVFRAAFLGAGLCGGLTTFSSVQVELLAMIRAGRPGLAAAYLVASIAAGVAAVLLGARLIRPGPLTRTARPGEEVP